MRIWPGRIPARGAAAFRQSVQALFSVLGVEPASSGTGTTEFLTIDGMEIAFEQTANEDALRMSAVIGLLSEDRVRRHDQMRMLLKRNLAGLRDYRMCCSLEETDDQRLLAILQTAQRYADLRPPELADRLSEMISLAEFYREVVEAPPQRLVAAGQTTEAAERDHIIFKP